jgi:carbamoyl-phosphate synthase large subunit
VATSSDRCNALLTFAGRKSYVYRILAGSSRAGRIVTVDADPNATVRWVADEFFTVPPADDAGYVDALLDLCEHDSIDCVIPLNDLDLALLAAARPRFEQRRIRVLGASEELATVFADKLAASAWLAARGFDTPATEVAPAPGASMRELRLPVVAKHRFGQASQGLRRCHTATDLARVDDGSVVQQWLTGEEYNLDILCDGAGQVLSVVPKLKLAIRDGSTDKARSVDDAALLALGGRLGAAIGHLGSIDVDVMVVDGRTYVLDINARLGGGFPFTAQFCPRYVDALLAVGRGDTPPPFMGEYRVGAVAMRDTVYIAAD